MQNYFHCTVCTVNCNCRLAKQNPQAISLMPGDPLDLYAMEKRKIKIIAGAVFEKLKIEVLYSGLK